MHRGGHRVHQRGEVRRTADAVEQLPSRQLLPERHEVDRLALGVEGEHRLVDACVLRAVEVLRTQEVADLEDGVGVDQDRAEHALLGLYGLRRQLIDAHRNERTKQRGAVRRVQRTRPGKTGPVC
jgi:hypothetical protein